MSATFTIHLARTGEHLEVTASDWREAVRQARRPDACHLTRHEIPHGRGPVTGSCVTAWFDPDDPMGVTAPRVESALATVVAFLDGQARGFDAQDSYHR